MTNIIKEARILEEHLDLYVYIEPYYETNEDGKLTDKAYKWMILKYSPNYRRRRVVLNHKDCKWYFPYEYKVELSQDDYRYHHCHTNDDHLFDSFEDALSFYETLSDEQKADSDIEFVNSEFVNCEDKTAVVYEEYGKGWVITKLFKGGLIAWLNDDDEWVTWDYKARIFATKQSALMYHYENQRLMDDTVGFYYCDLNDINDMINDDDDEPVQPWIVS